MHRSPWQFWERPSSVSALFQKETGPGFWHGFGSLRAAAREPKQRAQSGSPTHCSTGRKSRPAPMPVPRAGARSARTARPGGTWLLTVSEAEPSPAASHNAESAALCDSSGFLKSTVPSVNCRGPTGRDTLTPHCTAGAPLPRGGGSRPPESPNHPHDTREGCCGWAWGHRGGVLGGASYL